MLMTILRLYSHLDVTSACNTSYDCGFDYLFTLPFHHKASSSFSLGNNSPGAVVFVDAHDGLNGLESHHESAEQNPMSGR